MPLASLFSLQWYGDATAAMRVSDPAGALSAGAKSYMRANAALAGVGAMPLAKATRLYNSPVAMAGSAVMVGGTPRARVRAAVNIKVNDLSQDDVTGAVLESPIEGTMTLKEVLRLLLAVAAGNAQTLTGNPVFKSLDGSKTRVAGTMSAGGATRTITTRDAT